MYLNNFKILIFLFNLSIIITNNLINAKLKDSIDQCLLCDQIISTFVQVYFQTRYFFLIFVYILTTIKGMRNTKLNNFGGGNTDWEERKLGSYSTSETRFEEVMENICRNSENDVLT